MSKTIADEKCPFCQGVLVLGSRYEYGNEPGEFEVCLHCGARVAMEPVKTTVPWSYRVAQKQPTTVWISHTCTGEGGGKDTGIEVKLTQEKVYRGQCQHCRMVMVKDFRTGEERRA